MLPKDAWPTQSGKAVALRHFRVHLLHLPEGPEMTPIAEVCEAVRRLFAMVHQDWWAKAAEMYVFQYPAGSGEYGADDIMIGGTCSRAGALFPILIVQV